MNADQLTTLISIGGTLFGLSLVVVLARRGWWK